MDAPPRAAPASIPRLTERPLEEIFLRLPTPADLARASAACASFRRVITDRAFLRRFRALHPPPLLGVFEECGFLPAAEARHPSALLARALAAAADFRFSFVPDPDETRFAYWSLRDVRDGRVLLEAEPYHYPGVFYKPAAFSDLAVCDPVFRRHVLLPPIPDDLTTQQGQLLRFVPLLAPTPTIEEDEEIEAETSFKVICTAHYATNLVAFVFSSVTAQWRVAASPTWRSLRTAERDWCLPLADFSYARGCFHWVRKGASKVLVLDARASAMAFSIVKHARPPLAVVGTEGNFGTPHCAVVGREGALEVFSFVDDRSFARKQNKWRPENVIRLPREYEFSIVGATEGFLFLRGISKDWDPCSAPLRDWKDCDVCYFSLEAKTSELRMIGRIQRANPYKSVNVHPYFGFPPLLSKPTI